MKKTNKLILSLICIISLLLGVFVGYFVSTLNKKIKSDVLTSGDLKIHFLELGNYNSGDSILIEIGDVDILVDAGSKTSSLSTLKEYLDTYVTDNTLEYVIVTHAHEDHYANFAGDGNTSLFSYYKTDNIIQFATVSSNTSKSKIYSRYLAMVEKEKEDGANVYTALQCYNNEDGCNRQIDLGYNVKLEILYNLYYENASSNENNNSVCFMLHHGNNKFLFTGDLESDGEKKLIENNTLGEVTLFKAGHHGSNTSSSEELLSVIKPEIIVITCVAGNVEYTQNLYNTFPYHQTLLRIAKYTDKVYVTTFGTIEFDSDKDKYVNTGYSSLNGNIIVTSSSKGVELVGSNNSLKLKDSEWYLNYYQTYRNNELPW